MHFVSFASAALLSASFATAAPLSQPDVSPNVTTLLRRADPSPVGCGPDDDKRLWPLEVVQEAFDALVANGSLPVGDRAKANGRPYPQQFGKSFGGSRDPGVEDALNAIPECKLGQAQMKYFEFPITDPVFAGENDQGDQGPDRVIAISKSPGQGGVRDYTYCLALTHRGLEGNAFTPCA